jgi:integrase
MASLRTNKAGNYIVCFRLLGKQFNRELGTSDDKEAQARLKRIEATIHDIGTGRIVLPDGCFDVGTFVMSDGLATGKPALPKVTTVQDVSDRFLRDADGRIKAETVRVYRHHLDHIGEKFGSRPAESLTVDEVEKYVRNTPEWTDTYRSNILGTLVSAYKWGAERAKIISRNVLTGIKKPKKASRGVSSLIPVEVHTAICAVANPFFRSYLELLWYTGARPAEIACLIADHVDLEQAVCRLDDDHKLAHLGKVRLILLCPEAVAILKKRIAACPSGLLFPGEDGEQMTAKAIDGRLRRLCVKAGVKHSIPYGYRHSFGTDALVRGIPDATVAALLGHCGTAMLHKHYSHLTSRIQELRAEAAKVKKPA